MIKMIRLALLAVVLLYAGCKKDRGYYDYKNELKKFDGNSYDFLREQQQYDSFLLAIDRVQLTDSLKTGTYTVFAPSDASFKQAIDNMNTLRTIQGRGLMHIGTVPYDQLDSLVCRYMVRGRIVADSMQLQDGINLAAVKYGYTMHGKLNRTDAEGHVKGGPGVITYSDTKGVIYTNRWSNASTVAIDINTSNGLVNILEKDHMFGFDEFIPRMNPTYSSPWNSDPFFIPGVIGLEQFNRGGNRVAYLDFSGGNYGGQYRPADEVDIANAGEGGLKVGWTETNEWMLYTVQVTETGSYNMILRYGTSNDNGRVHLELDGNPVPGSAVIMPATGGYDTYNDIIATIQLTEGKHLLKLVYDFAIYDLRFLKFTPVGRPLPIPGIINLEDFDQGGEGVAYHDNNTANNANKWRPLEGVDIDCSKNEGGGYQIGWTEDGEWMNYTVDVKQTGFYTVATMVGTPNNDKHFHIEFDGLNVTGLVTVPNTSDYHKRQYVVSSVYLTKGIHVMRFFEDTGGYDVKSVTFKLSN
jgi:uncharacterized surface protein with fasciclin (FAS1) repeats